MHPLNWWERFCLGFQRQVLCRLGFHFYGERTVCAAGVVLHVQECMCCGHRLMWDR